MIPIAPSATTVVRAPVGWPRWAQNVADQLGPSSARPWAGRTRRASGSGEVTVVRAPVGWPPPIWVSAVSRSRRPRARGLAPTEHCRTPATMPSSARPWAGRGPPPHPPGQCPVVRAPVGWPDPCFGPAEGDHFPSSARPWAGRPGPRRRPWRSARRPRARGLAISGMASAPGLLPSSARPWTGRNPASAMCASVPRRPRARGLAEQLERLVMQHYPSSARPWAGLGCDACKQPASPVVRAPVGWPYCRRPVRCLVHRRPRARGLAPGSSRGTSLKAPSSARPWAGRGQEPREVRVRSVVRAPVGWPLADLGVCGRFTLYLVRWCSDAWRLPARDASLSPARPGAGCSLHGGLPVMADHVRSYVLSTRLGRAG